jgi:hypothetical protein
MMWEIPMLVAGGLFAGVVTFVAWERIPAWRAMDLVEFRRHFGHSIRRADRLQPAVLIAWLVSTVAFAITNGGAARAVALAGAVALVLTLVGSGAYLVPLQRRLVAGAVQDPEGGRRRWYRGHLARTALALASLALVAIAAAL